MDPANKSGVDRIRSFINSFREKINSLPVYVYFLVLLALFSLGVLLFFYLSPTLFQNLINKFGIKTTQTQKNVGETARPSPIPLASGKQVYNISGGKKGAPQIIQAVIAPIDPSPETTQSFEVKVNSDKPTSEVTVVILTDNKTTRHSLILTGGTELDGTWSGQWLIDDSYLYVYQIGIAAQDVNEKISTTTLTFR